MSKCVCACGARIDGREWQQRAEKAEAAIAGVREIKLVFPPDNAPPWVHGEARGWNKALDEVRRALDGERSVTTDDIDRALDGSAE